MEVSPMYRIIEPYDILSWKGPSSISKNFLLSTAVTSISFCSTFTGCSLFLGCIYMLELTAAVSVPMEMEINWDDTERLLGNSQMMVMRRTVFSYSGYFSTVYQSRWPLTIYRLCVLLKNYISKKLRMLFIPALRKTNAKFFFWHDFDAFLNRIWKNS